MKARVLCTVDPSVRRRVGPRVMTRLLRDVSQLVRHVAGPGGRVELIVCDDAQMRRLHAEHFGEAKATDVLSFPAGEPLPGQPDALLGQIVVNADAVARQAGAAGFEHEARSLCIHSVAHLCGHDHDVPRAARSMLRAERRLGRRLRTAVTRPYGDRR